MRTFATERGENRDRRSYLIPALALGATLLTSCTSTTEGHPASGASEPLFQTCSKTLGNVVTDRVPDLLAGKGWDDIYSIAAMDLEWLQSTEDRRTPVEIDAVVGDMATKEQEVAAQDLEDIAAKQLREIDRLERKLHIVNEVESTISTEPVPQDLSDQTILHFTVAWEEPVHLTC